MKDTRNDWALSLSASRFHPVFSVSTNKYRGPRSKRMTPRFHVCIMPKGDVTFTHGADPLRPRPRRAGTKSANRLS